MSTKSYTARLHQRMAAPRRSRSRPSEWLPATLALVAELGHLAAALLDWPGSTFRGMLHVLAAAALGVLAATVYFGAGRLALMLGTGLCAALPLGWLAVSPAWSLGVAVALVEITLGVLLARQWHRV